MRIVPRDRAGRGNSRPACGRTGARARGEERDGTTPVAIPPSRQWACSFERPPLTPLLGHNSRKRDGRIVLLREISRSRRVRTATDPVVRESAHRGGDGGVLGPTRLLTSRWPATTATKFSAGPTWRNSVTRFSAHVRAAVAQAAGPVRRRGTEPRQEGRRRSRCSVRSTGTSAGDVTLVLPEVRLSTW